MKFDDLATIPKKTARRESRWRKRRGEGRFEAAPYARAGPSRSARAEDRSSGLMRPGDHDDFADSANSRSPTTPDATFLPRSPTDYVPFIFFSLLIFFSTRCSCDSSPSYAHLTFRKIYSTNLEFRHYSNVHVVVIFSQTE